MLTDFIILIKWTTTRKTKIAKIHTRRYRLYEQHGIYLKKKKLYPSSETF